MVLALVLALGACRPARTSRLVVGSKNFTESLILGELLAQQLESKLGVLVERRFYLAGTYICQQAILAGRIDAYVEYTGTALTSILKERPGGSAEAVYRQVKEGYARRFGLVVGPPLGFDNSFALVVRQEDADRLHLKTISDAAAYAPHWRAGFGYEFIERPDGYQGLAKTYSLHFASPPRIMDLGLLYRALVNREVDIVAGNSTDGLIAALHLVALKDDRHYFPPYQAVPIVREQTLARYPEMKVALGQLAGKISAEDMRKMNYAVDGERLDPATVVRKFLRSKGL